MKSIQTVVTEVEKYLASGWHLDAAGAGTHRWPKVFALGSVTSAEADGRFTEVMAWAHGWHDWSQSNGIELRYESRRIRGVQNRLPTHVTVPNADTASRIAGNGWIAKLSTSRLRAVQIAAAFPTTEPPAALRLADKLSAVDFELALASARWFADNLSVWPGLTPRQVPIAGIHAKWLDTHRPLIKVLADLDDLALAQRGTRVYWTYLDPRYRQTGARVHDSLTLGDNVPLPYTPEIVLVVENKDTAILFPEIAGGIVVEGNGNASVGLLPQVPWIAAAKTLVYWGDLDAKGFEIVDGLRTRLPQLRTVLMDTPTYEAYERFGTQVDERGVPLKLRPRKVVRALTTLERELYENLTDSDWTRNRRLEQERIPLGVALQAIEHKVSQTAVDDQIRP